MSELQRTIADTSHQCNGPRRQHYQGKRGEDDGGGGDYGPMELSPILSVLSPANEVQILSLELVCSAGKHRQILNWLSGKA